MEPNRERIEDLMRRYGYEEDEAEIAYHLIEARKRLFALLRAEAEAEAGAGGWRQVYEETFIQSNVLPHFAALGGLLQKRVLARHYPEGWGSQPSREEEGQAE